MFLFSIPRTAIFLLFSLVITTKTCNFAHAIKELGGPPPYYITWYATAIYGREFPILQG